jgi:RHS repeat-associated protein
MTQANGTKCFEADYLPYGQEQNILNTCSSAYKFTGYEYDGESGNYYAFARYYSVRLQRFLSADPLMGDTADPQSLNRYAYVGNDPINRTDPTGMFWLFDFFRWIFGAGRSREGGGRGGIALGIGIGRSGSDHVFDNFGIRMANSAPQPGPPIGSEPMPDSSGSFSAFLPGETAGVPDWVTGSSDLSRWMIVNFAPGGRTWKSYVDYLDWLKALQLAAGVNLLGEIGHCKGGDAICIPGQAPQVVGVPIDHSVDVFVAMPFDAPLMESGAIFGTRYAGNVPLLNSNDYLRIGWTYLRSEGRLAWRATGKLLGGKHLWANPRRWF